MSIVVIGCVFVDIKGYPSRTYIPCGRNAGKVRYVHGGVSRNIAEDLGNLGLDPVLLSLVDPNGTGEDVLTRLAEHGVDTRFIRKVPDGMGTWLAVFDNNNDVCASISHRPDLSPLLPLLQEEGNPLFAETDSILLELDLDEVLLEEVFRLKHKYDKKIYAAVSNINIALDRRAFLQQTDCFVCNRQEAGVLFSAEFNGENPDALLQRMVAAAQQGSTKVSLRMGVFHCSDHTLTIPQRFDRASHACNTLRGSYRSGCSLYDMEMHRKELYHENLVSGFERAVKEKQFLVYYQPKYNIVGDEPVLCSAEALVRWLHPTFGMVSPGDFIPLFESNGLIRELDRYVWCEAAQQIRLWTESFGKVIPVSVNVSRADLYDAELHNTLIDIVEEAALQPSDCLLEITESAYSDNADALVATVEHLRERGFRIEMDDFGSGYSSLNMLTSLPIDALKLDMKFIRNICDNPRDLRMVELVREIADFMNIPIIAEGVETKEQYLILKSVGIDIIQGYYFSRPLPSAQFGELLQGAAVNVSIK